MTHETFFQPGSSVTASSLPMISEFSMKSAILAVAAVGGLNVEVFLTYLQIGNGFPVPHKVAEGLQEPVREKGLL